MSDTLSSRLGGSAFSSTDTSPTPISFSLAQRAEILNRAVANYTRDGWVIASLDGPRAVLRKQLFGRLRSRQLVLKVSERGHIERR
jgi:hypothetical protein